MAFLTTRCNFQDVRKKAAGVWRKTSAWDRGRRTHGSLQRGKRDPAPSWAETAHPPALSQPQVPGTGAAGPNTASQKPSVRLETQQLSGRGGKEQSIRPHKGEPPRPGRGPGKVRSIHRLSGSSHLQALHRLFPLPAKHPRSAFRCSSQDLIGSRLNSL